MCIQLSLLEVLQIIIVFLLVCYTIETHKLRKQAEKTNKEAVKTNKEAVKSRIFSFAPVIIFPGGGSLKSLDIKNIGKGPAFNIMAIYYKKDSNEFSILQNNFRYTGIAPEAKESIPLEIMLIVNYEKNISSDNLLRYIKKVLNTSCSEIKFATYKDVMGNNYETWDEKREKDFHYIYIEGDVFKDGIP
ncbi:MAG: hypothetical protein KAX38_07000 [Candidatus Krumholzibacteria bacterium]|nr:hypothetical protein [Candidatus Krumholzibacteria bacterium]